MKRTSIEAYEYALQSGLVVKLKARAMKVIAYHPGHTDREYSVLLGDGDPATFRRRRSELERMGLVASAGTRTCEVTGREAHTWKIASRWTEGIQVGQRFES